MSLQRATRFDSRKLRHCVSLQSPTAVSDRLADTQQQWTTEVSSQMACVRPLTGMELQEALQIQSHITHEVTMRYVEGINSTWRILFRGRVLHIKSVINLKEQDRFLLLKCTEET